MIKVIYDRTQDIVAIFNDEESYLGWIATVDKSIRHKLTAIRIGYDEELSKL